jgi:hypothetical protein
MPDSSRSALPSDAVESSEGGLVVKVFTILSLAFLLTLSPTASVESSPQERHEINTVLMESTFKVEGISKQNPEAFTIGTAFFLGRPMKSNPSQSSYVLITAGHVLEGIGGDEATIFLRTRMPDGSFQKYPHTFKIRQAGRNLYSHHSEADVVAMYFTMPLKDPFLLMDYGFLANDETLQKYEIHPGDELSCLGYPLGAEANEAGFPILRSGKIASYPLVPADAVKSYLYDFRVFEGNSGGPVYFDYPTRFFGGALRAGSIEGIVGLVTQQRFSPFPNYRDRPLELGVVVPAKFIIETINLLPER